MNRIPYKLYTYGLSFVIGQLLLAKGDVDQASAAFKIVLDGDQDNIPALRYGVVGHFGQSLIHAKA